MVAVYPFISDLKIPAALPFVKGADKRSPFEKGGHRGISWRLPATFGIINFDGFVKSPLVPL